MTFKKEQVDAGTSLYQIVPVLLLNMVSYPPLKRKKKKKSCLDYYKADFKLFITNKYIHSNNFTKTIAISEFIYFSSLVCIQLATIYPHINNFF